MNENTETTNEKTETNETEQDRSTYELREKIEARRVLIAAKSAELGALMFEHYMNLDGVDGCPSCDTDDDCCEFDEFREKVSGKFRDMLIAISETQVGIMLYMEDDGDEKNSTYSCNKIGYDPTGPVVFKLIDQMKSIGIKLMLSELMDAVDSGDASVNVATVTSGMMGDVLAAMKNKSAKKEEPPAEEKKEG